MVKRVHEIRDPIHIFVRLDSDERQVLNSRPFQRLRYIHQLALTYLVYPGATHRRFEHSLGVMELAGRVYDIVTAETNRHDGVRSFLPDPDGLMYWRRVLRMAALCHDLGHLPFSHAAEDLLPAGTSHEDLTVALIQSPEMRQIWETMTPPLLPQHIAKLAVGPEKWRPERWQGDQLTPWETLLADIIVSGAFGVDRMDYLLRDSYHAGVAYGRFDHYRLLDTLRILPDNPDNPSYTVLGIEEGGLQSAEALLLARYFMFAQLYCHHVRRIYDIHLRDFFKDWLDGGVFSTDLGSHLAVTDNEVLVAIREAAADPLSRGHDPASRIMNREHFRLLYQRNPADMRVNPAAAQAVYARASERFGQRLVRHDFFAQTNTPLDFPVLARDGRIMSALAHSATLGNVPVAAVDYVFIAPEIRAEAEQWLASNRQDIITHKEGT